MDTQDRPICTPDDATDWLVTLIVAIPCLLAIGAGLAHFFS